MLLRFWISLICFVSAGYLPAQSGEDSLLVQERLDTLQLWLENFKMDSLKSQLDPVENQVRKYYADPSKSLVELQLIRLQFHQILGEYEVAESYGQQALSGSLQLQDTTFIIRAYNLLAMAIYYRQEYDVTDSLCTKALHLEESKATPDDKQIAALYNLKALSKFKRWKTDEAIELFEKALSLNRKELGDRHLTVAKNYGNLAICYQDKGDYLRAIEYLRSTTNIFRATHGADYQPLATCYYNLALNYGNISELDSSTAYYWRAMELRKKVVPADHIYMAEYWEGIASNYADLQQYDTSLWYYEKAKAIFDTKDPNHYDAPGFLAKVGYVHLQMASYEKAEDHYTKALDLRLQKFGDRDAKVMFYRLMLGGVESSRSNFAIGQEWYDRALQPFAVDLKSGSYLGVPSLKNLMLVFRDKAFSNYQWFLQDEKMSYLDSAFVYSQHAMRLFDFMRSGYREDESRVFLSGRYLNVIDQSLDIIYEIYDKTGEEQYLEAFFTSLERKKATSLLVQLQERQYDHYAGVPDTVLMKEKKLQKTLADLEANHRNLVAAAEDSLALVVQHDLRDMKREYDAFISSLSQQAPEYYELKYQLNYPDVRKVQKTLLPGELLVSYHVTADDVFLFYCDNDRTGLDKVPLSCNLTTEIGALRDTFFNPELLLSSRDKDDRLIAILEGLSNVLIDPLPLAEWNLDRICIVPDGVLGLVPFDCLMTESVTSNASLQSLPYVCVRYDLYTVHSASVWLSSHQMDGRKASLLAFAPSYDSYEQNDGNADELVDILIRSGHLPLPGAAIEATEVARIWSGQLWKGQQANEAAFKKNVHDGGILHLSMHALVDQEQPMRSTLLFAKNEQSDDDGYLYASELYDMNLDASMVVLSACNTGYGKMARGEGTQSLSRAFAYAGVPSTVMSLWKIPDAASGKLMIDFYSNLKLGQTKPEALSNAKRAYLSHVVSSDLAHPFYWAGLVISGNPGALEWENRTNHLFLYGGLLLVLVSLIVLIKRRFA